jgi:hypothetical protein
VFGRQFSFAILLVFFVGSSLISVFSSGLAARLGGFRGLDVVNIALTTNARGGPGIVLASVDYDAGIINAAFYTTLVITAVVTSQMAGAWLRFVLSKGWPLLSTNPEETWKLGEAESGPVLPHGTEGVTAWACCRKRLFHPKTDSFLLADQPGNHSHSWTPGV